MLVRVDCCYEPILTSFLPSSLLSLSLLLKTCLLSLSIAVGVVRKSFDWETHVRFRSMDVASCKSGSSIPPDIHCAPQTELHHPWHLFINVGNGQIVDFQNAKYQIATAPSKSVVGTWKRQFRKVMRPLKDLRFLADTHTTQRSNRRSPVDLCSAVR